jgi:hypothetical protein
MAKRCSGNQSARGLCGGRLVRSVTQLSRQQAGYFVPAHGRAGDTSYQSMRILRPVTIPSPPSRMTARLPRGCHCQACGFGRYDLKMGRQSEMNAGVLPTTS